MNNPAGGTIGPGQVISLARRGQRNPPAENGAAGHTASAQTVRSQLTPGDTARRPGASAAPPVPLGTVVQPAEEGAPPNGRTTRPGSVTHHETTARKVSLSCATSGSRQPL